MSYLNSRNKVVMCSGYDHRLADDSLRQFPRGSIPYPSGERNLSFNRADGNQVSLEAFEASRTCTTSNSISPSDRSPPFGAVRVLLLSSPPAGCAENRGD